jgi:Spy/CpxP family protein refolding chaperone
MKRLAIALVVVTLIPATAFAQRRQGGRTGTRTRSGRAAGVIWDERSTLLLFGALLNLTDAQDTQLTTVFDAAAKDAAPLATAAAAGKNALFEAVKAGQSDDQLQRLAQQQGALAIKLQALQARTFAKMWALLTADQKAKVDDSIYAHIGEFLANTAGPVES